MIYSEFLIKPASAKCNLDCEYCFYKDISKRRDIKDYGFMSLETLESIVKRAYAETEKSVVFSFQGGEPLLVGIDYYYHLFEFINKYNVNKINTEVSIQTNGILIDEEFVELFKKHHVLVGVSLDGTEDIHNLFRIDYDKKPTYHRVIEGINLLKKYDVEFNILTVITKYVARNIQKIYQFYKAQGFKHMQFIEGLDYDFKQSGKERFSLNNKDYYKFLKDLFILWYNDLTKGDYQSIRVFDVMIHKLMNNEQVVPCFYKGVCRNQNIIEANGDIFPCDFYVTEKHVLGNIMTDSLSSINNNKSYDEFINESLIVPNDCQLCKYNYLCRNGCKRYRVHHKYYYCEAIYRFYDTYLPKLLKVRDMIMKMSH